MNSYCDMLRSLPATWAEDPDYHPRYTELLDLSYWLGGRQPWALV